MILSLYPSLADTLAAHYYVHQVQGGSVIIRSGETYPNDEEILLFVTESPDSPTVLVRDEGRTLQIYQEDHPGTLSSVVYERLSRTARLYGLRIDPALLVLYFEARRSDLVPRMRRMTAFIKNLTYGRHLSL